MFGATLAPAIFFSVTRAFVEAFPANARVSDICLNVQRDYERIYMSTVYRYFDSQGLNCEVGTEAAYAASVGQCLRN